MNFKSKITLTLILSSILPLLTGVFLSFWSLGKQLPEDLLEQVRAAMIGHHIIILPSIIALMIFLGIVLGAFLARTIGNIRKTMENLSQGDRDLTRRLRSFSNDELGKMIQYFNSFLEVMDKIVGETQKKMRHLTETGSNMSVNTTQTAAAIEEMSSNIHSIQGQINNQHSSVSSTEQAMGEITRNLDILSQSINDQAASIAQSSASIEEMVASIQSEAVSMNRLDKYFKDLKETARQGNSKVEDASEKITLVSKQSERLQEANQIISEIADQTTLLAMNAAIEAAHAGEAGRGFSVVADEIGKLAERSAEQSEQISQDLNQIITRINESVEGSRSASEAFSHMQEMIEEIGRLQMELKSAVEEQDAGGQQILEALQNMQKITRDVVNGSENMKMGEQAIQGEIGLLNQISEEVNQSIRELTTGTSEVNRAISNIQDISIENRESIEGLTSLLGQFKVTGGEERTQVLVSDNMAVTEDKDFA